ncbi:ATP synthase F0 subunit A [Candidatus Marinamargulisbacteria bacterium SCGC AG-410-N11]|nr:ATP synthase F0 subunit A [Candidatus Marinamargulisbacteria bacterium SCGC AG-410-N11]
MEELGKVSLTEFTLFGQVISVNLTTFVMTWVVMGLFLLLAWMATRKLSFIPGRIQNIFELIFDFLKDITVSTLGQKDGMKYYPFILTLFLFILLSNWIGIIPNIFKILGTFIAVIHSFFGDTVQITMQGLTGIVATVPETIWYSALINAPGIEEPTKSINTDLALAIMVFLAVQAYGIKNKGVVKYIRNFVDDPFPMKGPLIIFFFINPFFYLNLIGMVANVVSHSFRLFGNIFGGGMIIVIVSSLLNYFLVPVGLFAFFGLFAGLVQAFVFAMLAVTYIQQQQ